MEPRTTTRSVRFGEFELDHSGELHSGGRKIKLQEQPSHILRILMERPGEIVSREELRQKIWPSDTFVDFDHGINNAIKRLREALGDTAETPRYIETLPRRGYRFTGSINAVAQPRLVKFGRWLSFPSKISQAIRNRSILPMG
jgi:DNA-binding winged helix-turn-helix (wHTH) protein